MGSGPSIVTEIIEKNAAPVDPRLLAVLVGDDRELVGVSLQLLPTVAIQWSHWYQDFAFTKKALGWLEEVATQYDTAVASVQMALPEVPMPYISMGTVVAVPVRDHVQLTVRYRRVIADRERWVAAHTVLVPKQRLIEVFRAAAAAFRGRLREIAFLDERERLRGDEAAAAVMAVQARCAAAPPGGPI